MPLLHLLVLSSNAERRRALMEPLRAAGTPAFETGDPVVAAESLAAPGLDAVLIDLDVPLDLAALRGAIAPAHAGPPDSLDDAERRHIVRTLRYTEGNRRQAALILGISRSTLLHKIRKYRIGDR